MAFDIAKAFLEKKGFADRILILDTSIATVDLAARAIGTEPRRIAKSLTFLVDGSAVMVICAGDAKVSNPKFKGCFKTKAKMLSYDQVHEMIGHDVGGVCPFGIKEDVKVYLDNSLRRFETVFPACGDDLSAIELTLPELEELSGFQEWVDVTLLPE